MTVIRKINQSLPLIGVIAHTISQFTSSCTEKNMITHSTTASGTSLPVENNHGSYAHGLLENHYCCL
jgi:hypothetical protein